MEFQTDDIKKLAELSRIKLTEQEIETFREQLSSVLGYVEQVTAVDAAGVPADIPEYDAMRLDKIEKAEATKEELLESAPHVEEDHVSVLSVK